MIAPDAQAPEPSTDAHGTFRGERTPGGCHVTHHHQELPTRLDLDNHSPTGFEWGYGGSGPAQLALAILAACTTDTEAVRYHQAFKWACVARIGQSVTKWELPAAHVRSWLEQTRHATDPVSPSTTDSRLLVPVTVLARRTPARGTVSDRRAQAGGL